MTMEEIKIDTTATQTVLLDVLAEVFGAVDFFLDVQEQPPTFDVVQAEAWHRLRRVHERLRAVVGERGGRG